MVDTMEKNLPINTDLDAVGVNPVTEPEGIPSPSTNHQPRRSSKRNVLILPVLLLLIASIVIGILSIQKPQDTRSRATVTGTTLALSPATKTAVVGNSFTAGITLNTGGDSVSAAELHLTYDPTAVEVSDFTVGTILPTVLKAATINNGSIAVILASKLVPTPTQHPEPFNGSGILGSFKVKFIANKPSTIKFALTTKIAAIGKNTNALVSSTGTTISVGTTNTPTSTPIHTGTPTITPTRTGTPTPTLVHTATPTITPPHTGTPTATPNPTHTPTPTLSLSGTPNPTITPEPLQGDITGEAGVPDGVVDLFDYNAIVQHYGETGTPGFRPEDITGEASIPDGVIDLFDLNVVIQHYGEGQ